MASCARNLVTPGTPTSGTGYADRLTANAIRCDQARLLYRLQGGSAAQCPPGPVNKRSALYSSVLEQQASIPCQNVLPNGSLLGFRSGSGAISGSVSGSVSGSSGSTPTSVTVLQTSLNTPKAGVPESVRIQNLIQQTILASINPLDPATRFSSYDRTIVPLPCPLPIDSINPAIPAARTNRPICHLWPGT